MLSSNSQTISVHYRLFRIKELLQVDNALVCLSLTDKLKLTSMQTQTFHGADKTLHTGTPFRIIQKMTNLCEITH